MFIVVVVKIIGKGVSHPKGTHHQKEHRPGEMNMPVDGAQMAKRRRLNTVTDHQTQAARPTPSGTQSYLSLVCSQYNDGGARPANGAYLLASADRSASQDSLSKVEQEPSECCYGMVRKKLTAPNHTSARSLIELLRSYVTSPRSSSAD
jgi:hypothetical protein